MRASVRERVLLLQRGVCLALYVLLCVKNCMCPTYGRAMLIFSSWLPVEKGNVGDVGAKGRCIRVCTTKCVFITESHQSTPTHLGLCLFLTVPIQPDCTIYDTCGTKH